jgi:hypothetical protein
MKTTTFPRDVLVIIEANTSSRKTKVKVLRIRSLNQLSPLENHLVNLLVLVVKVPLPARRSRY